MKKIFIALSTLLIALAAFLPMAINADDITPTQDYEVTNGAKGMFIGGTNTVGTNVPRTWRNTDGLTIALTGVTTLHEQQFALGEGNAFLMNGIFTVTAPNNARFTRAEITFASTNHGTPAIKFPSTANSVTAPSDGSEKVVSYSFDEAVNSFTFEISGSNRLLVKKIRLSYTGEIGSGGSSSTVIVTQTVNVNMANGKWINGSNFHGTWESNTTPVVSIMAGNGTVNNMKDDNGYLVAYVGTSGPGKTFTIATEKPAYISKVKMVFRDFDSGGQATLTIGGKTYTASSQDQTVEISYSQGQNVNFVLDGPNKGIKFTTFEVTVVSEKTVGPSAPSVTVDAGLTTGSLSGGSGSWHHTWTSNRSNPQILIKSTNPSGGAASNMSAVNNKFVIASGQTQASNFTITTDGTYYVSHVKLSVIDTNGQNVEITMGGKSITTTTSEKTIEADFDRNTPAVFSLKGNNHNVQVNELTITLTSYLSGSNPSPSAGSLVINNAGAGTFDGGNANQGTSMPRTWTATVDGTPVTITLKGTGANGKQQLAADGNALLMCGQFTLALGGDAKITKAEFTMTSTAQGTPTLVLPSGSDNEKTTTSDAAEHTLSYSWDSPVASFDFDTKGSQKSLSVKSIKLSIAGGSSSGELSGNTFEIVRSDCQEQEGNLSSANYCRTLLSKTNPVVTIQCASNDNNIDKRVKDYFLLHAGKVGQNSYNVSVPDEFILEGISFNYRNHSGESTLIAGGKTYTGSSTDQAVTVSGNSSNQISFTINEGNNGVELRNFTVSVKSKSGANPTPDDPAPAEPITEETELSFERAKTQTVGSNAGKTLCASFTSTNTNPVITLQSNGKNNASSITTDNFEIYSGGTSLSWSFTVPNGFLITAVKMDYRTHGSNPSTIEFGGKTYTGTANDQTLSATGLNAPAFSFTINENNKGVELRNIKITVKPDPNASQEEDPGTPEKPTFVGGGDPVEFETSAAPAGQFAADTKWYVMTLSAAESGLPHVEGADRINLSSASAKDHNQQWCVTGDASTGYTIYNKAAGPGMMLAAPKEMKGTNGGDSYAILKAPGDDAYFYTWDITPANRLGKTSFFIGQHGVSSNKLNNRNGILAFWTAGADNGSSFLFYPPENIPQTAEYLQAPAIFPRTGEAPYNVCYRIPAIAVVGGGEHAGRIIAFSDYRKSGTGDISPSSNIDQHYTYSDDGGVMWKHPDWLRDSNGKPVSLARNGVSLIDPTDRRDNSFSDPCVAADRESGRIILMSPAGTAGFFSGQYPENPTEVARWFSYDGGDTWTEPDYDVTRQIHAVLLKDAYNGDGIDGMFWGSGKIHQSRYVKVGDYYRLYHAISVRNAKVSGTRNYVFYSDDFGENWKLLGDVDKAPVMSNGDEPKTEELPDGSVLLAARGNGGNRNWNIFKFTNVEKGEGEWGTHVNRNLLGQNINACNGEPLMVPAIDNSTGKECWVLLQSVPWNGNRSDVSIVYKKLDGPETYSNPTAIAENWEGRYRVSYKSSAYSTMAQMLDGNIAFIYEEDTWGQTYTEMFRKLSLSKITAGRYRHVNEAADPSQAFNALKAKLDTYLTLESKYVGNFAPEFLTDLKNLIYSYYQTRSESTLAEIDKMLNGPQQVIAVVDLGISKISNTSRNPGSERFFYVDGNTVKTTDDTARAGSFKFLASDPASRGSEDLTNFFIQDVATGKYFAPTGADNAELAVVGNMDDAGVYTYAVSKEGLASLTCLNPSGPHNSLHIAGHNAVVAWDASNEHSKWYIAPEDIDAATVTGIGEVINDVTSTPDASAAETVYDIYGRRVEGLLRPGNIYITNRGRKFIAR